MLDELLAQPKGYLVGHIPDSIVLTFGDVQEFLCINLALYLDLALSAGLASF